MTDLIKKRGLVWLAALMALFLCIGHTFSPHLFVDGLIASNDLTQVEKLLGHANWNLFTIVTLGQAIAFVITALTPRLKALGIFAGALALAVAANLLVLGLTGYPEALVFPTLYVNALLGLVGVIGSVRLKEEEPSAP